MHVACAYFSSNTLHTDLAKHHTPTFCGGFSPEGPQRCRTWRSERRRLAVDLLTSGPSAFELLACPTLLDNELHSKVKRPTTQHFPEVQTRRWSCVSRKSGCEYQIFGHTRKAPASARQFCVLCWLFVGRHAISSAADDRSSRVSDARDHIAPTFPRTTNI